MISTLVKVVKAAISRGILMFIVQIAATLALHGSTGVLYRCNNLMTKLLLKSSKSYQQSFINRVNEVT